MDWRALLAPTSVIAPWLGGRVVHTPSRVWTCARPRQWGWYQWTVKANTLTRPTPIDAPEGVQLESRTRALLVGDNAWDCSMPYTQRSVPLPPEGLPPFSVVEIGRLGPNYFVNRILFDTEVEEGVRIALGEERDGIERRSPSSPSCESSSGRWLRPQRKNAHAKRRWRRRARLGVPPKAAGNWRRLTSQPGVVQHSLSLVPSTRPIGFSSRTWWWTGSWTGDRSNVSWTWTFASLKLGFASQTTTHKYGTTNDSHLSHSRLSFGKHSNEISSWCSVM